MSRTTADGLFNNAGIVGFVGSILEYPEETFMRVSEINVRGVWLMMRAFVPLMKARGGGAIVNTSSTAGLTGTPQTFAYGASKHAVIGMTKSAAIEFAPLGIRVNAVCPAPIETPMMTEIESGTSPANPSAVRSAIEERMPLARYGLACEVATLVTFLCSEDASFITGAIYPIDGGRTATTIT